MLAKFQWRFFLLALLTICPIYPLYYFPILFKKSIESQFLDQYTPSHLEFLYNSLIIFYIFPNIFLLIFKQQLFEAVTLRRLIFLASSCLFLGEILFQIGFLWHSLNTMICSRAVFGLGAETLFSLLNLLLLKYFKKEDVGLLVAVIICISNILGAFSFPVFGLLYKKYEIREIMNINRVMAIIGYGAALGTVFYDLYLEKATRQINILLENFKKSKKNDKILIQDLYIGQNSKKKSNKINYYLFSFAFFFIPTVVCFNNFGSSYLLEKNYSNLPLKEGYFQVSLVFCLLWFLATLSASIMSFYLTQNPEKTDFLIYFTFLSILGHFFIIFSNPFIGVCCLGVSYGGSFSVFMSLIEKNQQDQDYILCVAHLGIMISSYFLAFVSQNGPYYSFCELVLMIYSVLSFLVAVGFFHGKEMKMREEKMGNVIKGKEVEMIELEEFSK